MKIKRYRLNVLLYKGELKKNTQVYVVENTNTGFGGKSLKIFPKEMLMAFSNSAQHNHQYTVHTSLVCEGKNIQILEIFSIILTMK